MRAQDIMTSPVVTVTQDTSIHAATALLAERGFTSVPVLDKDERLVGMVGERELMRAQASLSRSPVVSTVESAMRSQSTGLSPWSPPAEMAAMLADDGARSVPVLQDAHVVGIVTRRDLLKALARDEQKILGDVRDRLARYDQAQRWVVEVRDGKVSVEGDISDIEDPVVIAGLIDSVPGVTGVSLVNTVGSNL